MTTWKRSAWRELTASRARNCSATWHNASARRADTGDSALSKLLEEGADVSAETCTSLWQGERMDLDMAVGGLMRLNGVT